MTVALALTAKRRKRGFSAANVLRSNRARHSRLRSPEAAASRQNATAVATSAIDQTIKNPATVGSSHHASSTPTKRIIGVVLSAHAAREY